MTKNVLLIEDDESIGSLIEAIFKGNGYAVSWYKSGIEAVNGFQSNYFMLCVIDYSLPDTNGIHLINHLKTIDGNLPFLFITANVEQGLKYTAFEAGTDDFIQKPFEMRELVLRSEAIIRRSSQKQSNNGIPDLPKGFSFDYKSRKLEMDNFQIKLSSKEAQLLQVLIDKFNQLVTRKEIMIQVWGNTDSYTSKCLDVYLSKIRKIVKSHTTLEIINEHGVGYRLIARS